MAATVERISVNDARRPLFIGVDVGGTSIKIGVVDDDGRTLSFGSIATQDECGPEDAVQRIHKEIVLLLDALGLAMNDVSAIGLGSPGTMDIPAGMVLEPTNMPGWRYFPLRDRLSEVCDRPVSFANDASAAAFGESWIGSGREYQSIVMLTLGTGVGGGIIIGDMSIDGVNSHGSECGHVIIDSTPNARMCSCGQSGHLEAYASATAVVVRTEEALASGRESQMTDWISSGEKLSGKMLAKAAEEGDALALEIILETADYIAAGLVNSLHVIDPGAVIIGGAMTFGGSDSELGQRFLKRITDQLRKMTFPVQAKNLTVRFASLGSDAGYIGAAGIARAAFHKSCD